MPKERVLVPGSEEPDMSKEEYQAYRPPSPQKRDSDDGLVDRVVDMYFRRPASVQSTAQQEGET